MFKSVKEYFPLIAILITFIIITFIIYPFGNFPVNDDWDFYLHVKYFYEGNYVKNALIDAAFILQGFIGLYWVKIFGLSFTSLRVLTIFFAIALFFSVFLILKKLKLSQINILFALFSILADPFLIFSAYSFMTEIYFLVFISLSLLFFLKYKNPYLAITFALLSCFIRQFGYILLFSYAIYFYRNEKSLKFALISFFGIVLGFTGNFLFPAYTGHHDTVFEKITSLLGSFQDFIEKLILMPKYLPYLVFTILPIIIAIKNKINQKIYLLIIPVSIYLFFTDIFDLKNVFHLECYLCETDYRSTTSIFNNIPFKILLAILLSYGIIKFVYLIYLTVKDKSYKNLINSKLVVFIYFIVISIFAVLASDSFYDRYFLIVSVLTTIVISYLYQDKIQNNSYSWIAIISFLFIVVSLNIDFQNSMSARWSLGDELNQKTGLKSQIYVTGTFNKYHNAINKSPEELLSPIKYGVQKCYVLRFITSSNNPIENFFDSKLFNNKYLTNPKFSNAQDPNKIPSVKDNIDNLVAIKEYDSPIYNILGRNTYYVSFCNTEVLERFNLKTVPFSQ